MIYKAAAALPHDDCLRARHELRRQLRVMAVAAGAMPDWSTLTVTGPTELVWDQSRTLFEWTASIAVHGRTVFDGVPDPDYWPPAGGVDATRPVLALYF